jgi:hypothetical protein
MPAGHFVLGGSLISVFNIPALLPGGTIDVNGVPSGDLVMRSVAVFLPLLVAVLGVALFRAPPFRPNRRDS